MKKKATETVWYGYLTSTPVGPVYAAVSARGLCAVEMGGSAARFVDRVRKETGAGMVALSPEADTALQQIGEYLAGARQKFKLPLDLTYLTDFQRQVLKAALAVRFGQTATYGEIARAVKRPRAARAVGQALASNPIPLVIPCHRVLASDGALGGYSGAGGLRTKQWLLKLEGARL
jgi:methylated-DNA-[protein]-cysteine S-methyltransferase